MSDTHVVLDSLTLVTDDIYIRQIIRIGGECSCKYCSSPIPKGCIGYRFLLRHQMASYVYMCRECLPDFADTRILEALERYPCPEGSLCYAWHMTKAINDPTHGEWWKDVF